MNKYEIMFIVKTTMDEAKVKESCENMKKIVTSLNGVVSNYKEMGQRKLAYPIKKEITGFYAVMNVEMTKEALKEFDRKASLDESILRHLIIKLDKE